MKEHPGKELISTVLDGQASPGVSRDVKGHLADCGQCRQDAREQERINSLLCEWFEQELLPPVPVFEPPLLEEGKRIMAAIWSVSAVVLVMLSYIAWQLLTGWYSSLLTGLEQYFLGETARLLGQLPAAAAAMVSNPQLVEKILWRSLGESSALLAVVGMIYLISRNSRTGRLTKNTA